MLHQFVAPSILSADFARLGDEIGLLNRSVSGAIHFDVMDGIFVPNISFGLPVLERLATISEKPVDVHLMIAKPENLVPRFIDAGASMVSFHLEATHHAHRLIQLISGMGCKAGIAINPQTPVEGLRWLLPELDYVVLMSVNPGFGGQSFIKTSFDKLIALKKLILEIHPTVQIQIDGGVGLENAGKLVSLGADILVAGSSVFKSSDPERVIFQLNQTFLQK